jgi:D-glycero-D-manno-heptose 1,7-bisphosphate phosphatase
MSGHNRGIFLDRDGVLIPFQSERTDVDKGEIYSHVGEAIRLIRDLGYTVFLVTNHTPVAHGLISESKLEDLHCNLVCFISEQDPMAFIDGIYACPHDPEGTEEKYTEKCECRFPEASLLHRASGDFSVDLGRSFIVGDHVSSIVAAHLAGSKGILVEGPRNELPLEMTREVPAELSIPDAKHKDLLAVAHWLKEIEP